jgi:hypothetical protein
MRHAQDPRETDAKGILRPALGMDRFALHREPAPRALDPFVERLWTVRWSLPEGETFEQETLPHLCVHLVFEEGEFRVHGPGTRRFKATLRDERWVTGVKFTPAGFFAFTTAPVRALVTASCSRASCSIVRCPSLPRPRRWPPARCANFSSRSSPRAIP